jgi:hypothetical protein
VCISAPVGDPAKAIAGERETVTFAQVGERAWLNTAKLVITMVAIHLLGAVPLVLNATL